MKKERGLEPLWSLAQIVEPQDSNAFDIFLSQDIHLKNLEIIGTPGSMPGSGGGGVNISEASDVHIDGCNIHDNQAFGVNVDTVSVPFLRNTNIQNNTPFDGLDVFGSTVDVVGTTIQNDGSPGGLALNGGGVGVFIARNSIVTFRGNNLIQNNADIGIVARLLSTLAFQGPINTSTTIQGQNIDGILVNEEGH